MVNPRVRHWAVSAWMSTVHVNINFGGALVEHLPEGHQGNRLKLSLVTGVSLSDVLSNLGIAENERMLVILNGSVIQAHEFSQTRLNNDDQLSLMPPIQAG